MNHEYEETDIIEIEEDLRALYLSWCLFVDEKENGNHGSLHLPPALTLAATKIFQSTTAPNEMLEDPDIECTLAIKYIINYGAMMFATGQKAAQTGILLQNMLQCGCGEVSDEDLAKLVEQKS